MDGDASTVDGPGPTLHPRHKEWLAKRALKSDIAEYLGVTTKSDSRGNWLVFPYRLRGKVVNHKYRLTSEKQHYMQTGGKLCLWNADCLRLKRVAEEGGQVVITEGEFDALAAYQSGFQDVVSVPNGAPAESIGDPLESGRYKFLYESEDDLKRVKSFVLATDSDVPGLTLAHDLAAILGPERCKFVTYPEGKKDLNEVLQWGGSGAVAKVLNEAKPFPVKGLYRMSDFPDEPPVRGFPTGVDALADRMEVVLGTLTVFTGYSNMGKSSVMNTIVANAIGSGIPVCIASFETKAKPILFDGIARAYIGCSPHEFADHRERPAAYRRIEEMVTVITNALDEEMEFDLETFLDTARVSIIRDGARLVVIDPWNELEHKRRRDETLTEYVARGIRMVKSFTRRHNVAVWIIAHPTKPMKGTNTMPSLYDIADSAAWSNKADYGLVYHRPDKAVNEAQLAVVKVRMGLPGSCGVETVKYDYRTSRITATGGDSE